jgi:hypothetical protein
LVVEFLESWPANAWQWLCAAHPLQKAVVRWKNWLRLIEKMLRRVAQGATQRTLQENALLLEAV